MLRPQLLPLNVSGRIRRSLGLLILRSVDWADLPTVDLSLAATPEGMTELTLTVKRAMQEHGFFYVINHGLSPQEVRRR